MGTDLFFELSNKDSKREFKFKNSYSYISIKKVVISSMYGTNDWFNKLMALQPTLKITCYKTSGEKLSYEKSIAFLVTQDHAQPVFDFSGDFIVPEQNKFNQSSFIKHFTSASIELCSKGNVSQDVSLTIMYDQTPGTDED